MLKGEQLGVAIGEAIKLKIASGAIAKKRDVADHFGVRPPSIYDWIKKGSISKDKLFDLWSYFSDVVGPEHWGIQSGVYKAVINTSPTVAADIPAAAYRIAPKTRRQERIENLVNFANSASDEGLSILLYKAREIAAEYPVAIKQTPSS